MEMTASTSPWWQGRWWPGSTWSRTRPTGPRWTFPTLSGGGAADSSEPQVGVGEETEGSTLSSRGRKIDNPESLKYWVTSDHVIITITPHNWHFRIIIQTGFYKILNTVILSDLLHFYRDRLHWAADRTTTSWTAELVRRLENFVAALTGEINVFSFLTSFTHMTMTPVWLF